MARASSRVLLCDNRAPPGSAPRAEFLQRMRGALMEIHAAVGAAEGPVRAEHLAAAAKAREPRLGMKAARRLRQQQSRERELERLQLEGGGDSRWGLFAMVVSATQMTASAFGMAYSLVAPSPAPPERLERPPDSFL
mmetsp:Transcript_6033/g.15386  ORF Transcript_6033/g.15386 Transcript_6033/m.15386 type:complete len:137 (-) Transcript_6033:283-693(-)